MTVPRSETNDQSDDPATLDGSAVPWSGTDPIRVSWEPADRERSFALCVRGDVSADPLPEDVDVEPAPATVAADARLLSGSVDGDAVEVVVEGELLAASFEEPAPTVWIGDDAVDHAAWPPVDGAPSTAAQEPVPEPFPERGMLSKPLGDPLDPKRYEVEVDASGADEPCSLRLEVDGTVEDAPDAVEVTSVGDASEDDSSGEGDPDERATATVAPGERLAVAFRGMATWLQADRDADVTVRERD